MRHKSKLVGIMLIAVLLVGMLPTGSFAATTYSKGDNVIVEPAKGIKVEEFLGQMNKELAELYDIDTEELNFPVSISLGSAKVCKITGIKDNGTREDYGYTFAYGEPYGYEKGIPRYLGKTRYSTKDQSDGFTNIAFPYDAYYGWTFPDLMPDAKYGSPFIEKPWEWFWAHPNNQGKYLNLNGSVDNAFYDNTSNKEKLVAQIKLGIQLVHPELVGDPAKFNQIPWEKYVHIYQPPTYTAWGMGCIWHKDKSDGQIWYKTI